MLIFKRTYTFSAAHRLYNPAFSDEQNQAVFGKCNNPNFHGHNYNFEVLLTGTIDPTTAMLINLVELDALVNSALVDKVDHKNLNMDVPLFEGHITSAENIAKVFYGILAPLLPAHVTLVGIKVQESQNNSAEFWNTALMALPIG
jgi:6-pyruvoyltetrahydropterin/6-carboxytetrahydropterin synthase